MSVQRIEIEATAESIFSVLVDPYTYPDWLVGAQRIRSVDDSWPEPGSAFHHVVGFGPIKVADSTRVTSLARPSCLELNARARPFGRVRVRFTLQPVSPAPGENDRTELSLEETPTSPVLRLLTPFLDPGIAVRNDASLKRLREMVRAKSHQP
ncbi:MAG: hypothetical protein QOJ71_878 [Actinomycetota bacterium]|nr:hypothetical protein [Actinomycetota bacterium]